MDSTATCEAMENVLLIRLKSIGDVVLTLPAVNAIRDNFPGAKITFLTSAENAPLIRGFRAVDEVIKLDRVALGSGNPLRILPELVGLLRRLRAGKFSLVVDFQGYGETAWLSWLSGAPQRWGSVYRWGRAWAYTRGIGRSETGASLIADHNLAMLKLNGLSIDPVRNQFILPDDSLGDAKKALASHKLSTSHPTLFIQAFSSTLHKDWPLANYLELADYCREQGVQIIFGGGPSDVPRLEAARSAGFVVAAGTPLLVSAGLVKLSTVCVGGVTGLLHLAVAMQKRVIMLIGSAREPGFPYQHRDWGLTPKTGENVADIPVSAVIEACQQVFSERAGNASC